jgi:hypothetical protein
MAKRDNTKREILFSDVPGDALKVHDILAEWGVEEASIRRLLKEHRADPLLRPAPDAERGAKKQPGAGH